MVDRTDHNRVISDIKKIGERLKSNTITVDAIKKQWIPQFQKTREDYLGQINSRTTFLEDLNTDNDELSNEIVNLPVGPGRTQLEKELENNKTSIERTTKEISDYQSSLDEFNKAATDLMNLVKNSKSTGGKKSRKQKGKMSKKTMKKSSRK